MLLKRSLVAAYATMVRAERYALSEDDRVDEDQTVVPEPYRIAVSEYIIAKLEM